MNAQLVNRLIAVNRAFYTKFANAFSETRPAERMNLNPIVPYLSDGVKVFEVGCGNGRLAARLERERFQLNYLGIDWSAELIEMTNARQRHLRRVTAEFRVADVTVPGWRTALQARAPFDLAVALAVLHHVPSFDLRCAVLSDIHALLRPGGILLMSNWQFMHNERRRRKMVPWQTLGIDERELEPGDALLDWRRGGTGYRYCHWLTEAEAQSMAEQSGYQVLAQFYADADLNLFSVLKRTV